VDGAPAPLVGPPSLSLVVCFDASSSYPAVLLERARRQTRAMIERRAAPGHITTRVWARWITHDSKSVSAEMPYFAVGAVSPNPTPTPNRPKPTPSPELKDPRYMYDRPGREAIAAKDAAAVAAWEAEVAEHAAADKRALETRDRELEEARAQAAQGGAVIEEAPLPSVGGSDIHGCVVKAAGILARETGAKFLLIWSDIEEYGLQNKGALSLDGVNVRIVLHCDRQAACEHQVGLWSPVFANAHAASVEWFDSDADVSNALQ
jgi:hypothetical protein